MRPGDHSGMVTDAIRLRRGLIPTVATVLVLAACGSGGSPSSTASTTRATTTAECPTPHVGATVAYRTVPDVDANLTSLDVHPPARGCDHPVVVWVHGGGYRIGDKSNAMSAKVRWANDRGWVLVSVNYRLTRPEGDPASARYPDHYDDVAAAIAWVHAHIDGYGGDPGRIAVLGHSAGADIVSNVLVVPDYLRAHGLDLTDVVCGGPLDTQGFDKARAGTAEQRQWQLALGNRPDYLTRTSATPNVRRGSGIPPMIGVVRGDAARQAIERAFLDAVHASGSATTLIDARSLTHMQVNRSIGASGDRVMTPPLTRFLTECFAGRATGG